MYVASEDSDLRDLRSVDSFSTLGVPESATGDTAPLGARRLLDDEAENEQALIRDAFSRPATAEEAAQREGSMQLVQSSAARAAQVRQAVIDMRGRAANTQARGEEQEHAGVQGEGRGCILAIMDAVDQPLPSSDGSRGEAAEPRRKRRGREVQVAGGRTGEDVRMEKTKADSSTSETDPEKDK